MAAERAAEVLPASVKDGSITGTNKDLRRLTMNESKAILLKLGLSEEDIKGKPFLIYLYLADVKRSCGRAVKA